MSKGRLEAFSDGVIAILITIMVLELRMPDDEGTWRALAPILPKVLTYTLSFVYLGIYWSNHHHMLQAADRVSGAVLWANLHLLFWLSLVPAATGWMGEHHREPVPAAVYGVVMVMSATAYTILQGRIIACQGPHSRLREAVQGDGKGKLSLLLYMLSVPLAFVHHAIADVIFVGVALMWLVPDRRIETVLTHRAQP
ncbi:MAG TPA: TMEM175 family protein [Vicinamibacterales bacterium]